ncbi:winged helix-turn-helix domain-containing protein [Micromonospora peucetia]|uniref:Regulatory protein, arsR family n=1 Tax=Micromonospora peucetia TaxID=47871 RepID=A0A1C6UM60_9ACTN|nr:winged helix-turn-helix domain-containing protein [Micromonospora peucetia]MCX4387010.1 winged helix-turn-helix domain-containing protein [Micromonospora peucetia]WSA34378.1 winged helix-turn-helix domain-containing protein [Micromonospora peucetia]SCL55022.1 regulatory protein, arsR family [Micromonospora peucetia]
MSADPPVTGDELVRVLATLANPHRMRVVAVLARRRAYVSQLARELGISRALVQVHLRKLAAAGLVSAYLELSEDGKAMKYYEVNPFVYTLTPAAIATAADSLTAAPGAGPDEDEKWPA